MLYGFIHLLVSPFWSRIDGFSKLAGRELCQPDGTWYKGCKCHVYTAAKIAQVNVQKEDQFPEQAKKTSPGARGHVRHGDCGDISKPAMRVRSYSVYSIFSLHQPGKSPAKLPENWWRFHSPLTNCIFGSFHWSQSTILPWEVLFWAPFVLPRGPSWSSSSQNHVSKSGRMSFPKSTLFKLSILIMKSYGIS